MLEDLCRCGHAKAEHYKVPDDVLGPRRIGTCLVCECHCRTFELKRGE
jgi:nitrite reductase/ring-hydroxylating ferredoxin subunit